MIRISFFLLIITLSPFNLFANPDFEKFKQQQTKKYSDYKKSHDERYEAFKKELIAKWGVPETTTKDVFIAYSDNGNTKLVIDFEKDTIDISVLDDQPLDQTSLQNKILDHLNQTADTAINYDMLLNGPKSSNENLINNSILKQIGIENVAEIEELVQQAESISPEQAAIETITRSEKAIESGIGSDVSSDAERLIDKKQQIAKKKEALLSKNIKTVQIKRKRTRFERSEPFHKQIKAYAEQNAVPIDLILAITETESHFNPMAKSHVPAFGLMQIVPETAGYDVNQFKLKKKQKPSIDVLYDSKQNLFYGSSYLQILENRFFKEIKDPISRNYCVIAAYNTGVGNVAKAFNKGNPNRKKAIAEINKLTPDEVFKVLKKRTALETQRYLGKVLASREYFAKEII
jgi:membrane-bound lytic murein transglycosylase C